VAIDEILISASPGESRAAFLESGVLSRYEVARGSDGPRAGDVMLGRVGRIVPGIDAAFVEVGYERAGFLGLAEARIGDAGGGRIGDFVGEGDPVLVQVMREPTPGKGAKLTRQPTLPGRFLVMMPEGTGVHVSRRIGDDAARGHLENLLRPIAEAGGGWIGRSAALGADDRRVLDDARSLRALWDGIQDQARAARAPALLRRAPDAIIAAVIDEAGPALMQVVVDDPGLGAEVRAAAPDLVECVSVETGGSGPFASRDIDRQLEAALAPTVTLPGGGAVTFAETAAMVVIDVDTAGASTGGREETALAVNLEASQAIAHQVRLRDLAGYIAIDFVPMKRRDYGARLLEALREAFAADPRPTQVAGFTRLGVVEMTRRRRGPSLAERLTAVCPACAGSGHVDSAETLACAALRAVEAEARTAPGSDLTISAPEAVVDKLAGPLATALTDTEARIGRRVHATVGFGSLADGVRVAPTTSGGGSDG